MAPVVTMRQLLESGVHFGHQTRRWNPKMKRFILTERNGIYIIDLQQSLDFIDRAYEFIRETVAHGGSVLYVGTKKQAQEAIAEQARRVGMPFVNQRWLGGMLTNFSTVYKRLQRLKELEEIDFDDVAASNLTKKELLHLRRERDKLERSLGGIRDMARVPSAIWVVDTKKEHIAVSEARKLGIPVIAILDTNCDPDEVSYPIPGNDDAIRSVALLTRVVADAVADGLIARAGAAAGEEKPAAAGEDGVLGAAEPLAEWERELLLEGKTDAPAPANGTAAAAPAEAATAAAATADTATADTATADTATADTATADTATADTATADTATAETATAEESAPPEPAADDHGTQPRAGGAEAHSNDPLAAQPDAIDPADEVPTDEVPADDASTDTAVAAEVPAAEAPADEAPADDVPAAEEPAAEEPSASAGA
jgi:small subunit ribosomal protein S2